MRFSLFFLFLFSFNCLLGQIGENGFIRSIYDEALIKGESYDNLRSLCKDVGARITGSASADMAIDWAFNIMNKYDFDTVYLQKIKVPHWERGTREKAWTVNKYGQINQLNVLALGGSVATNGILSGELVMFESLEDLKKATKSQVSGKIVFLNEKMDAKMINTFKSYGHCYPIRRNGASESSKLGAKAIIIRSIGLPIDEHPHTGSLKYQSGVKKIPAAAISTIDAEELSNKLKKSTISE